MEFANYKLQVQRLDMWSLSFIAIRKWQSHQRSIIPDNLGIRNATRMAFAKEGAISLGQPKMALMN